MFSLIVIHTCCIAQQLDTIQLEKNGIDKLNILSTHPFGIYSARISQNFKRQPVQQWVIQLQQQSGNVFQPELDIFLPENPDIRERFANTTWFFRDFNFQDQETTPAQIFELEFDAVLKVYRVDLEIPVGKRQEIHVGIRGFTAVPGNYPFSYFSSDNTIEWFHSNIAGGEDAFGRRFYGLNQVEFNYTDATGRQLSMKNGELFLGGIEASYHWYPNFEKLANRNIFTSFAFHSGWNTTRFNRSMDAGISGKILKEWQTKTDHLWKAAIGLSILRKNAIDFDQNIDLGNNNFLGTGELMVEWTDITTKGNFNSLSLHYQEQTSYRKKEEEDYFHLKGNFRINAGWHNGYTTLLENLSSWTLLYTHGRRRIKYIAYVKEDLKVNNAPDLESGIGVRFAL